MTPDQILDGAADIIEQRGLAKGTLGMAGGPRCSVGAMMEAAGPLVLSQTNSPYDVAVDAFWHEACGTYSIPAWNDRPQTEGWLVATKMRHAAKRLRAGA